MKISVFSVGADVSRAVGILWFFTYIHKKGSDKCYLRLVKIRVHYSHSNSQTPPPCSVEFCQGPQDASPHQVTGSLVFRARRLLCEFLVSSERAPLALGGPRGCGRGWSDNHSHRGRMNELSRLWFTCLMQNHCRGPKDKDTSCSEIRSIPQQHKCLFS